MMELRMFGQDLRVAVRALRAARGFTATVLLMLSLSIGGVTAIFSAVDSVLIRPLHGITSPDRLVWLASAFRLDDRPSGISYPDFLDLRDALAGTLSQLAAYDAASFGLVTGGHPVRIRGHVVTSEYFGALGVVPSLGRFFRVDESQRGSGANVAVLSHGVWRNNFGSDSALVGRHIVLNGASFVVVGIAPPRFAGPELGAAADVWVPVGAAATVSAPLAQVTERRDRFAFRVFGRFGPDVEGAEADARLRVVTARIASDHASSHKDVVFRIHPFRGGATPDVLGETVGMAALAAAAGLLILVISCLNVANLVLARAIRRAHECSVRLALGSSRGQLIRYFMAENAVLAAAGGAAGVALAWGALKVAGATAPDLSSLDLKISGNVLAFALSATALSVVAFGVLPALHQARSADAGAVLAEQGRTVSAGVGRTRLQSAFIVAQLAVSVILLVSAGQVIDVLRGAAAVELGMRVGSVSTVAFDATLSGYSSDRKAAFHDAVLAHVSRSPSVASVALADVAPLSGIVVGDEVTPEGSAGGSARVTIASIAGDYFGVLGIPIVRGRAFGMADRAGTPHVAIINATAARRFWPDESPVGRRLRFDGRKEIVEVVGVAQDAKYDDPLESTPSFVYLPMAQRVSLATTTVLVRSTGAAMPPGEVKAAIQALEPTLALFDARTLSAVVAERLNRERATGRMLALAGIAGIVIAAVGLAGVVSYSVAQRTREIGIRQALGATPASVVRLVVRRGLGLAGLGAAIGVAAAFPVGVAINSAVFGTPRVNVMAAVGAACALIVVAAVAALVPALRAARITPLEAFRHW